LIPNIFFLALQLAREQDEIYKWSSALTEEGVWINQNHPTVNKVNIINSYSGIVTSYSEDFSHWELSDLQIVSGNEENRTFGLIKINAESNNTKYYLSPTDSEVDGYLKKLIEELGDEGFLVSDARENAFITLGKELTKDEFTQQTKLGKTVEIIISKETGKNQANINSIAIQNE
jgi:hypothetical protein